MNGVMEYNITPIIHFSFNIEILNIFGWYYRKVSGLEKKEFARIVRIGRGADLNRTGNASVFGGCSEFKSDHRHRFAVLSSFPLAMKTSRMTKKTA